jgi:hypothetical protein
MVLLVFTVLLNLAAPAGAQNTLQLPDVTLFGEFTLYLAAPEPRTWAVPAAMGLSDRRLNYPRSPYKILLAPPAPPGIYWLSIPPWRRAPAGLLPEPLPDDPPIQQGAGPSFSPSGWQTSIDYIPGSTVVSVFNTTRSSGVWDLSADLRFDLADGWVSSPPSSPTDLIFTVHSGRRSVALNIDAGGGLGAFYGTGASSLYTLDGFAELYGEAGIFRWGEGTHFVGVSGIDGGSPPTDADRQRGAVEQDLRIALVGSRFDLSLHTVAILSAGVPSLNTEQQGRVLLELGWRHPSSALRMWAGAAALYYDDSLTFYPSGGLELYPTAFLSLLLRAAPFVRLPVQVDALCALSAIQADSGLARFEIEGGYSLFSELRFDPVASFGAALSFQWIKGSIYFLDASDLGFGFANTDQGVLAGDLIWQIRSGRPGIRLNLTGELAVDLPIIETPWENPVYSYAGMVWTTDFHKLPLEFIIKALIGDYFDDGSQPFLFTNWEIVSGLTTSIEGNWKIGKYGTVHTGFEAFLTPKFSFRFLIGYGIRR